MKSSMSLVAAFIVGLPFYAIADDVLTKEQVEALIVGNSRTLQVQSSDTGRAGDLTYYHSPDGAQLAKNSFGETGVATYSITDDGKLCQTWTHKVSARSVNGCHAVRGEPNSNKVVIDGRDWRIRPGDAR